MPKKRAAHAVAETASGQAQRKRRRRPPWGKLLGGKPIKRHEFIGGEKVDLGDDLVGREQYFKMQSLLHYYGLAGDVPVYPVAGLVDANWLCWYQLALAIASELDDSLKIVDGRPPGKTAARWRGAEGAALIRLVDIFRKKNPNRTINWCLQQVQRRILPNSYGRMSLNQLAARYHEAKRHHRTTKQARNSERAS